MPDWLWPVVGFAAAFFLLARYFRHVAGGSVEHHAMADWVVIAALVLLGISIWQAVSNLRAHHLTLGAQSVMQNMHNPLDDFDACSTTGQKGGPPITNNPGCPGYIYSPPPEMGGEYFGSHPDLGPVPTLTPEQRGTR